MGRRKVRVFGVAPGVEPHVRLFAGRGIRFGDRLVVNAPRWLKPLLFMGALFLVPFALLVGEGYAALERKLVRVYQNAIHEFAKYAEGLAEKYAGEGERGRDGDWRGWLV